MLRRLLLSSLIIVVLISSASAQLPPPCPSNTTPPADLCPSTCIYCDFNGISSSTVNYTGQTPPGWCGTIENEQWLGFIANCTSVTFIAQASNCTNGNGIQMGVYTGCTSSPIACNGGGSGQANLPIVVTATTVPGQNYFLVVDGFAGDQCNFNITVAPPTCAGSPNLFPTLPISGPQSICPNSTHVFSVPAVSGASQYVWTGPPGSTINGQPSPVSLTGGNMTTVTVTFPSEPRVGVHTLCVQPFNSCNEGTEMCKTILIKQIPPTLFPQATVCFEDVPYTTPWGEPVDATGFYETTIITPEGCDSVLRQFVFVRPRIQRVLPPVQVCVGQTVNICGGQYGAGNHEVVCTAANGCDSTVYQTVIEFPISAQITHTGPLNCATPADTLYAAPGPGTRTWTFNGAPMGSNQSIIVNQPGTAILTVSHSFGSTVCTDTDTLIVTGNPAQPDVTISTPNQLNCTNQTVTLTASSTLAGVVYNWGGGNTTAQNIVSNPGTYTVTVSLPNTTCTATAQATVSGNTTIPSGSVTGTNISCTNPSASLTAVTNAPGAQFLWSNGAATASTTITAAGTYSVTITNPANGCTTSSSVNVNQSIDPPNVSATGGTISCAQQSASLSATSTTPGVTFAWSNDATTANTNVSAPGVYTVIATNPANGCTATATATINANTTPPNASATGGGLTCAITQTALGATSTTPGVTYAWSGPGGFTSTQQNPVANASGQYIVTVTAASNGCTATASANVALNSTQPAVSATGGTITCASTSTSVTASSPVSGATFEWFSGNVQIATGASYSATAPGSYIVVATDPTNGCTGSATASVIADPGLPNVSVTNAEITCTNSSAVIRWTSTTPGATGVWSSNNTTGNSLTVTNPGSYVVVVTNPANGCTLAANVVVADNRDAPSVSAAGGTLSCLASNLQLQGNSTTPGVTYAWTAPPNYTSNVPNPLVTDAGIYTLVVTNPTNGCTASATATVNADTNAPVASVNSGTLTCAVTSLNLTGTATTAPSPVTGYRWAGPAGFNSSQQSVSVTSPGAYTVTITSANGCTDAATVNIDQNIAAPAAVAATVSGVIGCTITSVDLSATSTTTGVNYAWSGSAGNTANVTVSTAGTYTVTVTNPTNGCSSTATVVANSIVVNPTVSATVPGELNCTFRDRVLTSTANPNNPNVSISSYAWSGPGGFTSAIPNPTITVPGTYSLVVTSNNGCTGTASVTVTQNIAVPNVTASGGVLTCSTPSITINSNSTTPGVTYLWTGACITPAVATLQNPSVCAADDYVVVVTAPNGCTSSATAVVSPDANAPVGLVAVPNAELTCALTSATITASSNTPGVTYRWSRQGNATALSTTANVTVSTPGTYVVTITAPNGCTTLKDTIITQNITPPVATTTSDSINCVTAQATLSVSTQLPATYVWSGPGGATGTSSSLVVTNPGTYNVVVTNIANQCTAAYTAQAIPNTSSPNVSITGGGILTCATTTVTLTGSSSTTGVTGAWTGPTGNPLGTAASINVTAPGKYTYTVTAPNGCRSSRADSISQNILPPAALVATASTLTCAAPNQPLGITTSTSGSSYAWSGPGNFSSTLQNPTANTAGTYTVTVTGPNGCTATATAQMLTNQDNPNLTVSSSVAAVTCANPTATLDANSSTPGVTYTWSGTGGLVFNSTLEDPTTQSPGTYQVVASAPNGCSSTATITLGINQTPPNASATGGTITCVNQSVTINGTSTTPGATYEWFLNGVSVSKNQNPSVNQLGNYQLVVTNPANGCTASANAQVNTDGSIPVITARVDSFTCIVRTLTINASSSQSGVNWSWTGPGGFTSNLQNPTITVPGNYAVTVSNPTNGCSSSIPLLIRENTVAPIVSIETPPQLDCNTNEVPIVSKVTPYGSHTFSYQWTTVGGNIVSGATSPTAYASQPGDYIVLITNNQNGCTATANETVSINPDIPKVAGANVQDVKCFGDTNGSIAIGAVTGGTAPYLYSIDGKPFTSSNTFTFLPPGQHNIVIQDANGCEVTVAYTIAEPNELTIRLPSDTTIRLGEFLDIKLSNLGQFVNEPNRADSFTYTPANFNQIFCDTCLIKFSTRYTVTVIDSNGCKATDDRLIKVDRTRSVVVPNVFNPSSTNGNNIFTLYGGIDVERVKLFQIYDRWGELVYEANNFNINDNLARGWTGKFRDQDAPVAVYIYVIDVLFKDGESEIYKGDCTLVK